MKFCRRVARQLFFERQKADKRHIKELRKGSVHNFLTTSLQKILLSAAGITMLTSPLFGASNSTITALGKQTTISYNDKDKTHTIETTAIKGKNAFNAFKDFTLSSNEIAELKFPENTDNLLNFVKNKINIQGTLNAVKNDKHDGNLYFLSSEGFILGENGVINAGAFYSIHQTKDFMNKFMKDDKLNINNVDNEIKSILDSRIIKLVDTTTVNYDSNTKTYKISTETIKDHNYAFNAFKEFTLKSGETVNFILKSDTDNVINFVKSKIDINGTVNAIKDSKICGNLYFLSSNGFILGKKGVINAGAFYVMTPTKGFMEKFIGKDSLHYESLDNEIDYILNRKISNYNAAYDYGVTINPYGEIIIEGKINTINGIGLYAGGVGENKDENEEVYKNGLIITNTASLNTFTKDQLSSFVNLDGIDLPEATDIVANEGKIELVSVQDNTHQEGKILEYTTGYTSFVPATAFANVETLGSINSRNDINISACAVNGHVSDIKLDDNFDGNPEKITRKTFEQAANIASISSSITIGSTTAGISPNITSTNGSINIYAVSENVNPLKTENIAKIVLDLVGSTMPIIPINWDVNWLQSNVSSNVTIEKDSKLEAEKYVHITAKTNSLAVAGANTCSFVTNQASGNSFFIPALTVAGNEMSSSSNVNVDGTIISNIKKEDDILDDNGKVINTKKSISILSESTNSLSVSTKTKSSGSKSVLDAAVSIGISKNKSELNIGKNANFDSKYSIDITSKTNSSSSVTSVCEGSSNSYGAPVVAISSFDSDAIANIYGKIDVKKQVGTFTLNVNNNIMKDDLEANSGLMNSAYEWQKGLGGFKKDALNNLYSKLPWVNNIDKNLIPKRPDSKFAVAGSVAVGAGMHNSKLYIASGASIITTGILKLSSLTYINDTHYHVTADIMCGKDQNDTLFQSSIGVLVNDYDYNSDIIIDDPYCDSDGENYSNTKISGNKVSIQSKVEQPYNRFNEWKKGIESAWKKLVELLGPEFDEKTKKVDQCFAKLLSFKVAPEDLGNAGNLQQLGEIWREMVEAFDSLGNFIKSYGLLTQDSIVGRFFTVIKKSLTIKQYSNFLNYSVSTSVNTSQVSEEPTFTLGGSIYVGNNSSNSNIYIGKDAVIEASNNQSIKINSTSDVLTTAMVGDIPIFDNNTSSKNAIGGSVIVHNNSSEANVLMARGSSIGSSNVKQVDIITENFFTPIEITMGTSSITNGLNGMASALVGSSSSNIRIDEGTEIAGKTINLYAYNDTNADNVVGAFTVSDKKGVGVGLAITLLDKATQILIEDNDKYWQDIRYKKDLRSEEPKPEDKEFENNTLVATITADVFNAVAKTTGTINTIGVAGGVEVEDKSKYDKFNNKGHEICDLCSGGLNTALNSATYAALNGILNLGKANDEVLPDGNPPQPKSEDDIGQELQDLGDVGNAGGGAVANPDPNLNTLDDDFEQIQPNPGAAEADLSLTFNGSAAANSIKNITTVVVDKKEIVFLDDAASATFNASAINSAHHLAFSGAAGIMAQDETGNGTSVGIDGTVAVNEIDNITKTLIQNTTFHEAKQIDVITINGGETVATGLGLQVNGSTHDPSKSGSGAINASVNIIRNIVNATASNTSSISNKDSNITNMSVTAYENDLQVTGGVSAAVGKQKGAVGVSLDVSYIGNNLGSEIYGGNYSNMKNVEVNALQASTIINAGIAIPVAVGVDHGSFAVSGNGVYTHLKNSNTANIKEANISADAVYLKSRDFSSKDNAVKKFEANLERNGKKIDFIDKEGKSFYTGFETASGTSSLEDLASDKNGSFIFTAALSGSVSGTSAGLGAAINYIDNTYNINVKNASITSKLIDTNALSNTLSLSLGIGAAVSTEKDKGSGMGSAAANSIANATNITFSNNSLKSDTINLNSVNDANLWGVGGAISVSKEGTAAVGLSFAVNVINNKAKSSISGGNITGIASETSSLSIKADNSSQIVGVAVSGGYSNKVGINGTVAVNVIDNNAIAEVGDKNTDTSITNLKSLDILATDTGKIYSLSGGVTVSKKACGGVAVSVNHIIGETASKLTRTNFDATKSKLNAFSNSDILSLAVGLGGGSDQFTFEGLAADNEIFRKVNTNIYKSTINNSNAILEAKADSTGKTGSLAINGGISDKGSVGLAISVNRIGGEVSSDIASSSLILKSLYSEANSYKRISNIGVGGSGASKISGNISFAYNELTGNTISQVLDSTIEAENNASVVAKGDDTLNNYAGIAEGSGQVAVGVSVSVNLIEGDTSAKIANSTITAKGSDSNKTVVLDNIIDESEIYNDYAATSTIGIDYSLHDQRQTATPTTGLVVDSSSTHTLKSFVTSISGSGEGAANANVNVNYLGGKTEALLDASTLNKELNGETAGNVSVKASDYTNTAGFIGNIAISGTAGIGASTDTNKVVRDTISKISNVKEGSFAKNVEVKADSKQGISSVVAGIGGSGSVGVAGNMSFAFNNATTTAEISESKISVNSVDIEANHYARSHVLAGTGAIGITVNGDAASIIVTNDQNHVTAGISSSTIDINQGSSGNIKINSYNNDSFESSSASLGGGLYAGVAGSVAVNYMENAVETNLVSSSIGSSTSRVNNVEIKSKDVSGLNAYGGQLAGGIAGVGATVFVNTYDGQTNTNVRNSKIYTNQNVDLGAYEERNADQFALGTDGGIAGVGSNILVINSGKKFELPKSKNNNSNNNILSESGSKDVANDVTKVLDKVTQTFKTDFLSNNTNGAISDEDLEKIFNGKPTYTASKDGNAVTLTKIENSVIDSSSGKITSNTIASGSLSLSNGGAAAGAGAVFGGFGFIYDNKNVITSIVNSNIKSFNGIDINSITSGKSYLEMIQLTFGLGDYAGAFAYVNQTGNTDIGIAGSVLENNSDSINITAVDDASSKNISRGITFGGFSVGTIISKAMNESSSDVTIAKSTLSNLDNSSKSNVINISSGKHNNLNAIGYSGCVSGADVTVISTLAQDKGESSINLKEGNTFKSKELNAIASNSPNLVSNLKFWKGDIFTGVGVGDVTTREYGFAKLNAEAGSKYNVNKVNMKANMNSQSSQVSEGYTVTVGTDIHVNKADTLSSSTVEVKVNIGDNDFGKDTILNVSGENYASATIDVFGVAVGAVISIANNAAKAIADLNTNVEVVGTGKSTLSQINVNSSSNAVHRLHANGDGGGLIAISPYAASTDSEMTLLSNANLSKNLYANKVSAEAHGTAKAYLTSDANQGDIIGGCGTESVINFDIDSNVNVLDKTNITADTVNLKADNDITTGSYYPNEKKQENDPDIFENLTNKGYCFGLISGSSVRSEQNIKSDSQVEIGSYSSILASKNINIDTFTKTNLFNSVYSGGWGVANHPGSTASNSLIINNTIITDTDSLLKTDSKLADINISTSYDIIATISAQTHVDGSGAGSTNAELNNYININNLINTKGNIYSYNDINLYADRNSNGVLSNFNLHNEAECYTGSIIPWKTEAVIKNNIFRNNYIYIENKSNLDAVRNITLSSKDNAFKLYNFKKEYTLYQDKDDVSGEKETITTVSEGKENNHIEDINKILVDGKVIAGKHNNISVKIDGKVAFNKDISGDDIIREPIIDCNTNEYKNSFKTGTMDYANTLFERYKQVEALCIEYSGTIAGISYEAEKARLLIEMEKYGLYDPNTKQVIGKLEVEYVEIPDMVSSGGNIYINASGSSSVFGEGLLKAQGAPKIQIENNSNLYMKVNDLFVIEPGGDIIFNNNSLGQDAKSTLSGVTTVETDNSKDSLIEVKENWKGKIDLKYTYVDPTDKKTKTKDINYDPLTNIEINGHIDNEYGGVYFYNAYKDIVLQGKTAEDSASVNGATISINAPNGSIAQGYTKGTTNIGYTPEAVLKEYSDNQQNSLLKSVDLTKNNNLDKKYNLDSSTMNSYINKYKKPDSGVWLAGGSVFLNGDDININGLIQSGYSKYELTLSDSNKEKIQSILNKYNSSGKPKVTEAYLEQNCRINESGKKWNSKEGYFDYVIQAYFNPETNSIILEDVTSQGGKIYLTGRISNTLGGKIYAADGASDIIIDNKTGYNLTTKTLDVGNQKGFISIMDLAKNDSKNGILATLTEMTNDSTKVWTIGKNGKSDKPISSSGKATTYTPLNGLTYNWSTGYDVASTYKYESSYQFWGWDWFEFMEYGQKTTDSVMEQIKEGKYPPSSSGSNDKMTGNYIGTPRVSPDNGYSLAFQNIVNYTSGPESGGKTEYDNWTHFSGTQYFWLNYKTGTTRVFQHSIKADYPISIKFLQGNGNIDLTTDSYLTLNSDITSKNGKVNLTSTNGSIEQQGGNINSNNIWLNATNGIGSKNSIKQKMYSSDGVLSAITQKGDINLLSTNSGSLKNTKLKLTAVTDNGNTKVVSDASLLQGGNNLDVKGSRIDLISNYGSIGSKDSLLKIQAGQNVIQNDTLSASINANAYKDVALEQTKGDMRIGKIISQSGDVYLTSEGSVLDALPPGAKEQQSQSAEQLIEKWIKLGIISESGDDNSEEKKKEAIEVYEKSIKTGFARYEALKKRFNDNNSDKSSDSYEEYLKLKDRFGNCSSAEEWLEAQNKDKNSQWYILQNETDFGWTQDQLLYAIQDSIINREGSIVVPVTPEDANIKGRNITIKAGGGIGLDSNPKVYDISDLQSEKGLEALKAIAAAEASDVKWGYDGDIVDKNKATISGVSSIKTNANGTLSAAAKGNIYLEDCNNNAINLISVASNGGNVRVLGNKGIYNATKYVEGSSNNIINLAGKDLIIEAGDGSIGTAKVPVTTNMSGIVSTRSNSLINLYQLGINALTFYTAYSGGNINIRALNDILSVYKGEQSTDMGVINAKGDITLYSDEGDIGQANGKGLRVKLLDNKTINAEAESVYLKGDGNTKFNLDRIIARSGNIGIESKKLDLLLNKDISAMNIELIVKSVSQIAGSLSVKGLLNIITDNGILVNKDNNSVAEASFVNNKSGDILFKNNRSLTLHDTVNKVSGGNIKIENKGSITSKNGLKSNGELFIWSDGNIDIQKDSSASEWMGIYADNGSIKAKSLKANSIDLSAEKNGLTTNNITSNTYIKANVEKGNITTGNLTASNENISLITHDGNISSKAIKGKKNVNLTAYNGSLTADSIESTAGSIEAIGYKSLTADTINAADSFFVGSLGDISINSLKSLTKNTNTNSSNSDDFDDFDRDKNTSYLLGKNIDVKNITANKNFEVIANGKFTSDNINIEKEGNISAQNDISINSIKSGNRLDITSHAKGGISINEINNIREDLKISNEIGDIQLKKVNSGKDVHITNGENGNISITDSLITRNEGSFYANIEDGDFYIKSGDIAGEASIYSEKGNIELNQFKTSNELDIRAKNGSIDLSLKSHIGEDATIKSDSNSVRMADTDVKGNLKISARKHALILDANVGGSMLMKGDEEGCTADILNVGKDLIVNTQTGSIDIENATVGEDTYISIDGNGGNIDIENIKTGRDLTGDLIVVSHSNNKNNDRHINITNAVAANKLIINGLSDINLKSAYALNGKLEVKTAGDIVAEVLKAAKTTYIATTKTNGLIDISKLISGDSIGVYNVFGSKTNIDYIETTNPDADINIAAIFGENSKITNASASRNLSFKSLSGNVYLENIYAGNDIEIESTSHSNIDVKNTNAGNNVSLTSNDGDIKVKDANVGNNLDVKLKVVIPADSTNEVLIENVNVGHKTTVQTGELDIVNINKLKTKEFELTDYARNDTTITNSDIGNSNITVNGNFDFIKSNANNMELKVGEDAAITDSTIGNLNAKIGGNLTAKNLENNASNMVVGGNAYITNSTIDSLATKVGGIATFTDSTINNIKANVTGDLNIANLVNNTSSLEVKSNAAIASLTSNNVKANIDGNTQILDSSIGSINANVGGDLTLNNIVNSHLSSVVSGNANINNLTENIDTKLTIDKNASITNSNIGKIDSKIGGNLTINNLSNNLMSAIVSGKAEITNLTSDEVTADIVNDTTINKSNIGKLDARIGGNTTIACLTSNDVTATIGGNTLILDSSIGNINSQIAGNMTVDNLLNKSSMLDVSGNAIIASFTSNDTAATIGGNTLITYSSVDNINAQISGDLTAHYLENINSSINAGGKADFANVTSKDMSTQVGKDVTITDSSIDKLNTVVGGGATITNLTGNDFTAVIANNTNITDSVIGNINANIGGDLTVNNLDNNSSIIEAGGEGLLNDISSNDFTVQIGKNATITDSNIVKLNATVGENATIDNIVNNRITSATIGGNASITNSYIDALSAKVGGDTTIDKLINKQTIAEIGGNTSITNTKSDEVTATIDGNTQIKDSKLGNINAQIGGDLTINKLVNSSSSLVVKGNTDITSLTSDEVTVDIGKDATITESNIGKLDARIDGNTTIASLTSNDVTATIGGNTLILDSSIGNINSQIAGNMTVDNLLNKTSKLDVSGNAIIASFTSNDTAATIGGNTQITYSSVDNINAQISGDLTAHYLENINSSINAGGKADFANVTSKDMNTQIGKDVTITDSRIDKLNTVVGGSATITNLTGNDFSAVIANNTKISDSTIGNIKAQTGGDLTVNNLDNNSSIIEAGGEGLLNNISSNDFTVQIGKNVTITDSNIVKLNATVGENATIDNLVNNRIASATIGGNASITNSYIDSLSAKVGGDTTIDKLINKQTTAEIGGNTSITNTKSDNVTATIGGNTQIADSKIGNLNAQIGGYLTANNLVNNKSTLEVGGYATITSVTSNDITATINGDTSITDSSIGNLNAQIGGNTTIASLTSNDVTATIGGNTQITDSKLGNIKAQIDSDLTINQLVNSRSSLVVKGNTNITNMTSDEVTANISKDATITDSSIVNMTASVGGNATIDKLVNNQVASATIGGDASITNSTIDSLTAKVGGNTTIDTLTNKQINATIGGNTSITNTTSNDVTATISGNTQITDSKLGNIDAQIGGDLTVNQLVNSRSSLIVKGNTNIANLTSDELTADIGKDATITDSSIVNMTASVGGNATIDKLVNNKSSKLTVDKDASISDSSIVNMTASIEGNATIDKLANNNSSELSVGKNLTINQSDIKKLTATIGNNAAITESSFDTINAKVNGNASIATSTVNTMTAVVEGTAKITEVPINKLDLTANKGAIITRSEIKDMKAVLNGKSSITNSDFNDVDLTNKGEITIKDSSIDRMTALNDGKMELSTTPVDALTLTNNGDAYIHDTNVNRIITDNNGEFKLREIDSDKLELTSKGNTKIDDSVITDINANISGSAEINNLVNTVMTLVVSGNTNINNSVITKFVLTNSSETKVSNSNLQSILANNSGSFSVTDTTGPVTSLDITNSGSTALKNIETSKIKLENTGSANLTNLDVTGTGYLINKNGKLTISNLDASNNFDINSNAGSINMSGIDVNKDFNFALTGNTGVKFTDITVGNDFNLYAGKATLNGNTLNVGNNLNTSTYSKYTAPKASTRAAVSSNNVNSGASENDEGFTLILDQLNVGGGIYVENPDVTIQVKESEVGHDVKIDAGKEKIQIDKLDVDGGNLDIKGDSGAIKLGEVKVDNDTKIKLASGDLSASSLDSKGKVDFKVGGNITSDQIIKSENSTVNAVAGGNLSASTVEAKGNIDFNAGGNISSDNKIETETESVNMIAGGGVDAYKILAQQQGNIEAVNGDIIIGQINGRTLVFKQDTNDRTLRIYDEANVETRITAAADFIDIEQINHNGTEKPLNIDFNLVNGRAMDNVVIRDVRTDQGVNMFNLVSMYGNIHVSNELFNLTRTYLLKRGDLSNSRLKFRLFGDNPTYSKEPDIIAYFAPRVNHKSFADISFTNVDHPGSQDYYPLIAKGDYKRMFNQYTVVQEFETLRLSYEDRIEDTHDDVYSKFDYRKLDNTGSFYDDYDSDIYSDGENINLDGIDIPLGFEFNSVSGEIRAIGVHLKPRRAID